MYKKNQDGSFTVQSVSGCTKDWAVSADMKTCDCPKFKFILKGMSPCHHIDEVRDGELANATTSTTDQVKVFKESEYYNDCTMDDFINMYGDTQYDLLMSNHTIIRHRGFIVLLK